MVIGLITSHVVSQIGLMIAFVFGYLTARNHSYFLNHFIFSVPAALLAIFSHCMTMFYFIGTGKQIKEICKENNLDPSLIERTRTFKSKTFPMIMAALGTLMTVTIIGGGVLSGLVPPLVHEILAYIALIVNVITMAIETKYLAANNFLLNELSESMVNVKE